MSKITNALIMVELLESGKKYSLKELANELGVTERMVRYYKEQLELAGIIIESYKGPNGGYFINKRNQFKLSFFNKYDIDLLNHIAPILEKHCDEKMLNDYKQMVDRLESVYEVNKTVSEYSEVDVTLANPNEMTKLITEAIRDKSKLNITYQHVDGRYTKRDISPLGYFQFGNITYVTAFCYLRGDIRHFELSKIIECEKK